MNLSQWLQSVVALASATGTALRDAVLGSGGGGSGPLTVSDLPNTANTKPGGSRSTPPNVILLLAEDLGYGDLGCYGHPYAETPALDRLASEGRIFTNFHSTGKTCAPARAGLMTARHPATMAGYAGDYGFRDLVTVSDLFRDDIADDDNDDEVSQHRYGAIGHVGKWHIGEDLEREADVYGFTDVRKISGVESAYWYKDEAVADAALDFIQANYQKPFYLQVWGHVAHSPIRPKQHLVDRFADVEVRYSDFGRNYHDKLDQSKKLDNNLSRSMATYLGALYSMDHNVQRILDALDELGIANHTIVAFTADHGAAPVGADDSSSTEETMLGYGGGLRGYKHSYYEGGVRVPLIVRWPGVIPAGTVDDSPMSALDWLPTIATLAQVPYEADMFEGESFADAWLGSDSNNAAAARNRSAPLFWNKEGSGDFAMLSQDGRWKLHFTVNNRWELYDLVNNIEEDVNLVRCRKDIADQMKEELKAWTRTLPRTYCRLDKGCDPARFGQLERGQDGNGPETCSLSYM